ncbi:MAG: hypothetical protein J7573_25260, partial [Pseudomonas sp.]|nr:hypothetical protein [Pseudomonas sp.]
KLSAGPGFKFSKKPEFRLDTSSSTRAIVALFTSPSGMAQSGMSITGVEEIDGVLYAQPWWCRVE